MFKTVVTLIYMSLETFSTKIPSSKWQKCRSQLELAQFPVTALGGEAVHKADLRAR